MNLRPIICVAAALVLTVAGCAGGVGQQRENLAEELHRYAHTGFKNSWREYLRTPRPQHFALARDGGRSGYSYCAIPSQCPDANSAKFGAIQYCQSGRSVDCDIYARGRRIVWPHDFPWSVPPAALSEYRASIGQTAD